MIGRIRDLGRKYESGSQFFPNVNEHLANSTSIQSLSYDSQAVEAAMNLESAEEQTFDTALHTESENKGVNDVNESMQTSTNVTENNSNDPALWENIDDVFRLCILENGLSQKTIISFTNSKRTYDDCINRILEKNISTEF